jgi:hypothetical protein
MVEPAGTGAYFDAPNVIKYVFPQVFQILKSGDGRCNTYDDKPTR